MLAASDLPAERFAAMLGAEACLSAQEAVELGFADAIGGDEPPAFASTNGDVLGYKLAHGTERGR